MQVENLNNKAKGTTRKA